MVSLKAFSALRPPVDLVTEVVSPPYDVISTAEARELAGDNPNSFLRISRPELALADDAPAAEYHALGAAMLADFVARGTLVADDAPAFLVYRLTDGDVTQTGLVGVASTEDYDAGRIAIHEYTRPDKEDDRTEHITALGGHDEPVFLMYRSESPEAAVVAAVIADVCATAPTYDFTRAGVHHTVWAVSSPEIVAQVEAAFAGIDKLYVADGHHRCAASARVAREVPYPGAKNFPALVCSADELNILGYHRVVKDLMGRTPEEFLAAVADAGFHLEDGLAEDSSPNKFGVHLAGKWHTALAYPELTVGTAIGALDVSILQNNVLNPLLGIADPRTDARIAFVGGSRGTAELERLVDSGDFAVAFAMHPTSAEEVMNIADQDGVMPPKSTWFEPKPVSGLFVHKFA